jgi:enolase
MVSVLIRNVPSAVVENYDQHARLLKVSRNEVLRQRLISGAPIVQVDPLSESDWEAFSLATEDLSNDQVMQGAWS